MRAHRPLLAAAVLLGAGVLRLPLEQAVTTDLRAKGLLSAPLDIELKERIGQNSTAIALSGLRTLVAVFYHLKAVGEFAISWNDPGKRRAWERLEDAMDTTVQLAPRGSYYWDMGAWHMAYNASSWHRLDSGDPPVRARAEARRWIDKGRRFYERGIASNPGNWELAAALGNLLSDPHRFPDDRAAAEAYRKALTAEGAPASLRRQLLFAEARAGDDLERLRSEVRELLKIPSNRVPNLLSLAYVLEYRANEPDDPLDLALAVFGSEDLALRILGNYYFNGLRSRMPDTGVEAAIRRIEGRRGIAPDAPESMIHRREIAREQLFPER